MNAGLSLMSGNTCIHTSSFKVLLAELPPGHLVRIDAVGLPPAVLDKLYRLNALRLLGYFRGESSTTRTATPETARPDKFNSVKP